MDPDLNLAFQAGMESRPSDFQNHVNDILGQRIVDALERRKSEMAAVVFNHDESSEEINSDENQADNVDTQIEEPNGQDA